MRRRVVHERGRRRDMRMSRGFRTQFQRHEVYGHETGPVLRRVLVR